MATSTINPAYIKEFYAEGTINQYHAVKLNSTNEYKVEECDTEGEVPDGIALETVTDEQRVSVFLGPGPCKAQVGATTTANGFLQVDDDGEFIDAATTGHYIVAKGYQAGSAADSIIEIYFYGPAYLSQVGD